MKEKRLEDKEGLILIVEKENDKRYIRAILKEGVFSPNLEWETSYPVGLIEKIFNIKGSAWTCNEIMRDENEAYISNSLKYDLLSYISEGDFSNKRILDFGSGCGASTSILARMFPDSEIVGIEYVKEYIEIAELRKEYYNFKNVNYLISPNTEELHPELGKFDFIILSGVFEHLLPVERNDLFVRIWDHLQTGGILFLNNTPHRYFPVEMHTTSGLPFLNYFPDKIAMSYSKKFSKRSLQDHSWNELLRAGIRGGSVKEIIKILKKTSSEPVLLNPERLDVKDRIDLWYKSYGKHSYGKIKKNVLKLLKIFKFFTGIELPPYISLAIKKIDKDILHTKIKFQFV